MSLSSIISVDYVVLLCRDLNGARSFYSEVLGFDIVYERSDWIKFQVGQVALTLRPESGLVAGRKVAGPALQLAFEVSYEDVNRCYEELKHQGVNIVEGPKDQTWGHRTLFFTDPEGNVLEIYAQIDDLEAGPE